MAALAGAQRTVAAGELSARSAVRGPGASALACVAPPASRAGGRGLRLAVVAKEPAVNKIKTSTGSFVPWADGAVQRVFQLSPGAVDWAAAAPALQRSRGAEAKGIVALAKAELDTKGAAALTAEKLSMTTYVASRSLAVEVWLALAAARAGLATPAVRRAFGVVVSSVSTEAWHGGGDRNAFAVVGRALAGAAGDAASMATLLEAEVKEIVSLLNDDDYARAAKPSRLGYDAGVTEQTLTWLCAAAAAAAAALPAPLADGSCAPLAMPALREGSEDGDASDADADVLSVEAMVKRATAAMASEVKKGGFGGGGGAAKKGFGGAASAAATAAALAFATQKLPDFAAQIRKGVRVSFPELASWATAMGARAGTLGKEDQVTPPEAVALLLDFAMRCAARPGTQPVHLWLPGEFMAAAVTFGAGTLGPRLTVGTPGGAPVPPGAAILWAMFDPPAAASDADVAALKAALAAAKAAGAPVVTVPVGRVRRAQLPGGADEAAKALRALAAERLARATA